MQRKPAPTVMPRKASTTQSNTSSASGAALQQQERFLLSDKSDVTESISRFRARTFLTRSEEAREWLQDVLQQAGEDDDAQRLRTGGDLVDLLKDGTILCKLARIWLGQDARNFRIHSHVTKGGPMEFAKSNDNINAFFDAARKIEFPSNYEFSFPDVWDRANITSVIHCMHALAHYLESNGLCSIKMKDLSKRNLRFDPKELERIELELARMEKAGANMTLFEHDDFSLNGFGEEATQSEFSFDDTDATTSGFNFDTEASSSDFSSAVDATRCSVDGTGLQHAVAGEWAKFSIVAKNQFGRTIQTGGSEQDFAVYLVNPSDPMSPPIRAEVVDAGNGRYDVAYCSTKAGDYELHVEYGGVPVRNSPFHVKVSPGQMDARSCVMADPGSLALRQHVEGCVYQFHLQCRDKFGNPTTRGMDNIKASMTLKQSKYAPTSLFGKGVQVKGITDVRDNGDGTILVSFKAPLPGKYSLQVRMGDDLKKIDCFGDDKDIDVTEAPAPQLRFNFEQTQPGFSVVQLSVVTAQQNMEGNQPLVSDPKWCSIVLANATPSGKTGLSAAEQQAIRDAFQKQFAQWLDQARKKRAGSGSNTPQSGTTSSASSSFLSPSASQAGHNRLSSSMSGMTLDDLDATFVAENDDDGSDVRNFFLQLIDGQLDQDVLCEQLKDALSKSLKFNDHKNSIDYVVLSDAMIDWAELEDLRRREMQLFEDSLRAAASAPGAATPSNPNIWTPNNQMCHPRTCELNFWVIISALIAEAKATGGSQIDEEGQAWLFETRNISVRSYNSPDVFNVARKQDVKLYCDLMLQVSQAYVFELIDELRQKLHVRSFQLFQNAFIAAGKESMEHFKIVFTATDAVVKTQYFIRGSMRTEVADKENLDKVCRLVSAVKRKYLTIIRDHIVLKFAQIMKNQLNVSEKELNKLSFESTFFKTQLPALHEAWYKVMANQMSLRERKIMVQELLFKTPFRNKLNQIITSQGHCVQVPLNCLFDTGLYGTKRSGRSTKDRSRQGLVNAWKSVYIKSGVVMFESIRSGSIAAIGINQQQKRLQLSEENAKELLRSIAANQVKRFARQELLQLMQRREQLNVTFTSLGLLTPSFVNDREDRQLMEHQSVLLDALKRQLITEVTVDLHDGQPPMTVPVRFQDVVLLNFGSNLIIKTFKMGQGIQRAINNRSCGFRSFEKKVLKFLQHIHVQKARLRQQIIAYMNEVVFRMSRTGAIYQTSLSGRIRQMEHAFSTYDQEYQAVARDMLQIDIKMLQKQKELEHKMRYEWLPKFDSVTSLEFTYQWKIRGITNEILNLHSKIVSLEEKKLAPRLANALEIEGSFMQEVSTILNQSGDLLAQRPLTAWNDYVALCVKEKDIRTLFDDLRSLYHSRQFESFAQGLYESESVKETDPYAVQVRVSLLSFLIGEQTHMHCKSGKDRTGVLEDEIQEFCEMRAHFDQFPNSKQEKDKFNEHRRMIWTNVALNGGSLEIIRANIGVPGSKVDTQISGRFLSGYYRKYKSLSKVDKIQFAGTDADYEAIMKDYLQASTRPLY